MFFISIALLLLPVWARATNNTPNTNTTHGGGGEPLQFSNHIVLDGKGHVGLFWTAFVSL